MRFIWYLICFTKHSSSIENFCIVLLSELFVKIYRKSWIGAYAFSSIARNRIINIWMEFWTLYYTSFYDYNVIISYKCFHNRTVVLTTCVLSLQTNDIQGLLIRLCICSFWAIIIITIPYSIISNIYLPPYRIMMYT